MKTFQMEPALDEVGQLLSKRFRDKGLRVKALLIAYDDAGRFHTVTNVTDEQAIALAVAYLKDILV